MAVSSPPTERSWQRPKLRTAPALTLAMAGMFTLGFNETRVGELSLSDLLFVIVGGIICAQLLHGTPQALAPSALRRSSPAVLLASLTMLTGATLSTFWSSDPGTSMLVVVRYAWLTFVWFWILRAVIPDRPALYNLLAALRAGALLNAGVAILGYIGLIPDPDNTSGRQSGFFGHANGLAGFLVMCLPFFLLGIPTIWTHPDRSTLRNRWLPSGVIVFALATTGSITGAFAAMVATVVALVAVLRRSSGLRRRSSNPIGLIATGLVCTVALILLVQSDAAVVQRFSLLGSGDSYIEDSADVRTSSASFVLERFDQYLLIGRGLDRQSASAELSGTPLEELTREGQSLGTGGSGIHNMLIKLYYEAGGLSLVGFLTLLVWAIRQAWTVQRVSPGDGARTIAIAVLASIAGLNVLALFQPMGFERFYWFPIALAGVLWGVRRAELRSLRDGRRPTPGRPPRPVESVPPDDVLADRRP